MAQLHSQGSNFWTKCCHTMKDLFRQLFIFGSFLSPGPLQISSFKFVEWINILENILI